MLKKILIAVLVIIVVLVIVGLVLPTEYHIVRSITIDAPPETVYALVSDLERWGDWGPWQETDPSMKITFAETAVGEGGRMEWTGRSGSGWLEITSCDPARGVDYEMAFVQGQGQLPSTGYVALEATDAGTEVTWGMDGKLPAPVIGGYIARFLERGIGAMYDKGLENLKVLAEETPPPEPQPQGDTAEDSAEESY